MRELTIDEYREFVWDQFSHHVRQHASSEELNRTEQQVAFLRHSLQEDGIDLTGSEEAERGALILASGVKGVLDSLLEDGRISPRAFELLCEIVMHQENLMVTMVRGMPTG